jgi:oxaloacetate decarboxylase alpha subunit
MPRTPIARRHALECLGDLRCHAGCPDGRLDAPALNVHGVPQLLDLRRACSTTTRSKRLAKVAKEFGSEVAGAIMFTLSPVHTDEYYAKRPMKLSVFPDIDTCFCTTRPACWKRNACRRCCRRSSPSARQADRVPFATTCSGSRPRPTWTAIELGVNILHTASRPMANGPSVPSTESDAAQHRVGAIPNLLTPSCWRRSPSISRSIGKAAASWSISTPNTTCSRFSIRCRVAWSAP